MLSAVAIVALLGGVYWLALGRPRNHYPGCHKCTHGHKGRRGAIATVVMSGAYLAAHLHQFEMLLLCIPIIGLGSVLVFRLTRRLLKRRRYVSQLTNQKRPGRSW
jgi:hypothetical protein